jgi:uncharacterized membrane protein YbhN (UPF0104 family)
MACEIEATVAEAIETMASLGITRADKLFAAAFAVANWAFDILCFAWAIKSIGLAVPWSALVLAWAAGAGAASFNLTPGGLGVVEPALAATLVAAGLPATKAMAAIPPPPTDQFLVRPCRRLDRLRLDQAPRRSPAN